MTRVTRNQHNVRPLGPTELDDARRMREAGASWKELSRHFGRGVEFFQSRLIPGRREQICARSRASKARMRLEKREGPEGIAPRPKPVLRMELEPHEIRRALELRKRGYGLQGIARDLKAPYKAVSAALEAHP